MNTNYWWTEHTTGSVALWPDRPLLHFPIATLCYLSSSNGASRKYQLAIDEDLPDVIVAILVEAVRKSWGYHKWDLNGNFIL